MVGAAGGSPRERSGLRVHCDIAVGGTLPHPTLRQGPAGAADAPGMNVDAEVVDRANGTTTVTVKPTTTAATLRFVDISLLLGVIV
jgi:hypothetical protein